MVKKLLLKNLLFLILIFIVMPVSAQQVYLNKSLDGENITTNTFYYEDKDGKLSFEDIKENQVNWKRNKKSDYNFGFSTSTFWFKMTANNPTDESIQWYYEVNYPMLDYITLYIPRGKGKYGKKETGDHRHFDTRDIKDRTFVFNLSTKPGKWVYYLKISTVSSVNFSLLAWKPINYFNNVFRTLPLFWIYYGLMMIMVIYNLLLFFSIREINYVSYALFFSSWILFQFTINGFSFQYLWPRSTWWANNCLPFFMAIVAFSGGLFSRHYMKTKETSKFFDKIIVFLVLIPSTLLAIVSLFIEYKISIKLTAINSAFFSFALIPLSIVLTFKGNRSARFFLLGFGGLLCGIAIFVFKTFGMLPSNFFTNWSIQIGSSLIVVLLSLGLADQINTMRKNLSQFNVDMQKRERNAKERAKYLENVVKTVQDISDDMLNVSHELDDMGRKFSDLAMEQSSTSEEMSATFEQLVGTNNNIYQRTLNQKDEGKKTRELSELAHETQTKIEESSQTVVESIDMISDSTNVTEFTMRNLIEKIEIIDEGGKAINEFVVMIDDITERINLLSLNAAIEAARAGEHGRGFAVVADEIGKLAQATSDNSREISDKIKQITKDINEGMGMVKNTRDSIDITFRMVQAITKQINNVKDLMTKQAFSISKFVKQAGLMDELSEEITMASRDQNTAMEQNIVIISRLSEIAQEIAQSSMMINNITESINRRIFELGELVKNIE